MKKNDEFEVLIDDIGSSGEGIAHKEYCTIFIPFAIPGEKCLIHILKVKNNLAWAKLIEVKNKAKERIMPKCEYYQKCGGCNLQHVCESYELELKANKIITAFKKYANIELNNIQVFESDKVYSYRNKSAFPIRIVNGDASVCMFKGNTHTPIKIKRCELVDEDINKIIAIFNKFLNENKISVYDEIENKGLVKFLVVRIVKNVPLITIVINGNDLPMKQQLIHLLIIEFDKFGLNLNINKNNNNVILTDKFIHVYGEKELENEEFGITYPISSLSFLQINDYIKSKIYQKVLSLIDSSNIVIDAYSGAGLLSAMIAKKAKMVYGIEIIKPATENANKLADKNKINNLKNINGDCSIELPQLVKEINNSNIKIVLDPPRKGCDKKVIDAIISSNVAEIIYVSCNPATLARDAKLLFDANYKLKDISAYNMFPQTEHVETLAIFCKE